jgi:hypothetical protein
MLARGDRHREGTARNPRPARPGSLLGWSSLHQPDHGFLHADYGTVHLTR